VRYPIAIVLALACSACARREPAEAAKAAPAKKEPAVQASVVLAAAAQKDAGVAVEPARYRSLAQVLSSTARLTNDENQTWRVGAIAEGRIVHVLANPGDVVKTGQVLARMHSHNIHESRAEYRKAVNELARAQNQESSARRVRDRARRLYEIKAGSQEQWELAETELRNAQTTVANARYEVERTRNHLVEFLGIPADFTDHQSPTHNDNDDYIPVRAPATGVVLARNVTSGTVVTPANDLFVVSDLSRLWAMAEVNEEYLGKLRVGMPVRVSVQAYPRQFFPGRIGKLGESLDPATRTVKVRVDVPNAGGKLKPEMYATTAIELGGSERALFVPEEATQEVRGQTVVFVRTAPDRFEARPVQTGRGLDGAVEIVRGLKDSEAVAVRGAFVLKSEFLKASLAEE